MLLGLFLAVFGPLLTMGLAWALSRWVLAPAIRRRRPAASDPSVFLATVTLVAALIGLCWIPGKLVLDRSCAAEGVARIWASAEVDGFYREDAIAPEVTQYLLEGFHWVEARDPYHPDRMLRYALDSAGRLVADTISVPSAEFGVSVHQADLGWGVQATRKRIFRLDDGAVVAVASELLYSGGPLSVLVGAWLTETCPDIRAPGGSEAFDLFYRLESRVLRGGDRSVSPMNSEPLVRLDLVHLFPPLTWRPDERENPGHLG